MYLSKNVLRNFRQAIGITSVSVVALSLSSGAIAAADSSSYFKRAAGLTAAQKAGGRGNLSGLFKSPRRVSSTDQAVVEQLATPDVSVLQETDDVDLAETTSDVSGSEGAGADGNSNILHFFLATEAGPEALEDVDPTSRKGKLAAYRFMMQEVELLNRNLTEARKVLSKISMPVSSAAALEAELRAAGIAKAALQVKVAEIETSLDAVGGVNAELEAALVVARAAFQKQKRVLLDIAEKKNAAETFEQTMKFIELAEGELAMGKAAAHDVLVAAFDTPVTSAVVAEVHRILQLSAIE